MFQTLSLVGNNVDPKTGNTTSAGGVVDLDRSFGGVGLNWVHKTRVNDLPLQWTVGVEADRLKETRQGFLQ